MHFKKLTIFWNIFKNSFKLFKKHDTATLGAALAYYTGFSLIPILIIVLSIAGIVWGPAAVQGEIKRQLQSLLGEHNATQLQDLIMAAYAPGKNWWATAIATILLIVGATSVFGQMRTSLNTIWNVTEKAKKPVLKFFLNRVFSVGMIACLAFLLLISMSLHAGIAAFSHLLNAKIPQASIYMITAVDLILSFGLTTLMFAFVYKYMSDAKLHWRSVWPGAAFTAFLFVAGKYIIGYALSTYNVEETYGAAGSMVLLLMWVFYSSQIIFFGAEFTHAIAVEQGVVLDPWAIKEEHASIKTAKELGKA